MLATEERYPDGCIKYKSVCPSCSSEFLRKRRRKSEMCNTCISKTSGEATRGVRVQNRKNSKYKTTLEGLLISKEGATQKALLEFFTYLVEGVLIYNFSTSNRSLKGTVAGSWSGNGYKKVNIEGSRYLVHRLVYTYHFGTIPEGMFIDHIDRDPTNNRIENLRVVTPTENSQNSLPKGYVFSRGRYIARIVVNKKSIHIGTFDNPEDAQSAYYKAKDRYHI